MSKDPFVVIGMHYGGHDTSAALSIDGEIIAACEQERYSLDKHSREFPIDAINDCLRMAGLEMSQVSEIAFGADYLDLIRKTYLQPALEDDERIGFLIKDIDRIRTFYEQEKIVRENTGYDGPVRFYRHHLCHLASAYYPSGFDEALLVSIDGMGELETGMIGFGRGGSIEIHHDRNHYPHSLGLLYSAITFFLGWKHHCDEGIIMGLAPFGDAHAMIPGQESRYIDVFREIVRPRDGFDIEINLDWIAYHKVRDTWISDKFKAVFGEKRDYQDPLEAHHKNIAAALQLRLEEIVLGQLAWARKEFGFSRVCIAGGVGLNCSMNGKLAAAGLFDEIYVQPAAGDAGISLGAVYLANSRQQGGSLPIARNHNSYLGARFEADEVEAVLQACGHSYERPDDLYDATAKALEDGLIIGWFQGGAEFGPRALGNRSILCRPFPEGMRDHLNARVKFREEFRPFAPAVLAEYRDEYFVISQDSPHMLIACQVQPDKKEAIPAVVHIDDSCRVQTVLPENNARFRALLEAFHARTDCPVLLNTSFNVKGQPIVNTPQQAVDCFLSTNIDVLIVGDFLLRKSE